MAETASDPVLVDRKDLRGMGIKMSRTQLYRMIGAGQFPRPVEVSDRIRAWRLADVTAWLRARPTAKIAAEKPRAVKLTRRTK